jgi:F0F1-type ATP synthase membrane subunit b/b'
MDAETKALITSLADRVLRLAVAKELEKVSRENTNAHLQQIAGHLSADVTAKLPTQMQALEQRIDQRLDAFEREIRRVVGGEKQDHGKLLAAFAATPRFTQVLIVLALLLMTASGWLAQVLK